MRPPLEPLRRRLLLAAGLAPVAVLGLSLAASCGSSDTGGAHDDDDDERPWKEDDLPDDGSGPWDATGQPLLCGDLPVLSPELAEEYSAVYGSFLVCAWPDVEGDCLSAAEFEAEAPAAVVAAAGEHPDSEWCDYLTSVTCGPDPGFPAVCCYETEVFDSCSDEGRPFRVGGVARRAPLLPRPGWALALGQEPTRSLSAVSEAIGEEAIRQWREASAAEHASIASFSRFALELLAVGAPPELVQGAVRAMADEVRHARLSLGVVELLGGEAASPGPLPVAGALSVQPDLASLLTGTLLDGCINETLAAAEASRAALCCDEPVLREVLEEIARDEEAHAALAWRTVSWVLSQEHGLAAVLGEVLASARPMGRAPLEESEDQGLAALGRLPPRQRAQLQHRVWKQVIDPVATSLLAQAGRPPAHPPAYSSVQPRPS